MIDTIIFDLDGVLINSKDIHFKALNKSLNDNNINYEISIDDHLKRFDGLPTLKKLEILNKEKKVPKFLNKKIQNRKHEITRILFKKEIK